MTDSDQARKRYNKADESECAAKRHHSLKKSLEYYMSKSGPLPRILAPDCLTPTMKRLLDGRVQLVPWDSIEPPVLGIYCYGHAPVGAKMLDQLPGVRVISNHGVGVDHIDLDEARRRGIPVGNTPRILDGAVADMAFALLLAAARRLVEGDRFARHGSTTFFDPSLRHGHDVHGATIGIIGLGNIGSQIAQRARGFDMRIVYVSRREKPMAEERWGARRVELDELLASSDFVVIIVPLTLDTRGLIGRRELALMKPTATLVNISRGPVVDTDALAEALLNKRIFSAALDVTEPEPLPRNHPLLGLDNVTLTPHLGSATVETRQRMAELSIENLFAGLEGRPLTCRIA